MIRLHPHDRLPSAPLPPGSGHGARRPWRRRKAGRSTSIALVTPCLRPLARLCRLATGAKRAVQPHHQPVGPAGRPGLVDAHHPDAAALQRLQKAAARGQRRGDPEFARHLGHHVAAVMAFLQHELDQPVARREDRQPAPPSGAGDRRAGIARQMAQTPVEALPPSTRISRCRQLSLTVTPLASGNSPQGQARPSASRAKAPPGARRQTEPEAPFSIRSATQPDAGCRADPFASHSDPVGAIGQRRDAGDAAGQRHWHAALAQMAIIGAPPPAARRRKPQGPSPRPESSASFSAVPPAMDSTSAPEEHNSRPSCQTRLSGTAGSARTAASSSAVLGPKRAVQRRNGDRLAAKEIEDRVEDHPRFPQ